MSNTEQPDEKQQDSSAQEQDSRKTEKQQTPPSNRGRTFSGTGVEKRG